MKKQTRVLQKKNHVPIPTKWDLQKQWIAEIEQQEQTIKTQKQ